MQQTLYGRVAILSEHLLVALGANLPWQGQGPEDTIGAALERLSEAGFSDLRRSRLFRTPCFPPGAGPDYVNAAASAFWPGSAESALQTLHRIEAEFGRERAQRWGMRTLDLDLIAFGADVVPDPATHDAWATLSPEDQRRLAPDRLIVPHPRLAERAFVLVPLADVAPDWQHPLGKGTIADMLAALDPASLREIRPLHPSEGD